MTDDVKDPYAALGVARDATLEQIRRAYESKLNAAAAANALHHAQRIDAAYSVLRDPHRRAAFDRDGTILELPRLSSDLPPPPPDRPSSWGSAREPSRPNKRRRGRLRTALTLTVAISLVGAAVQLGVLRHATGQGFANDVWRSPSYAPPPSSGTWFPMKHAAHRTRLLPAVNSTATGGTYAFEEAGSTPTQRWDPCTPIRYVVSGSEPYPGATKQLTSAIEEVSADTGLQFVYAGTTSEIPSDSRVPYQPTTYGQRWAPVLIAWTDSTVLPKLAGNVVGLGGPMGAAFDGQARLVSGIVALDDPDLAGIAHRRNGAVETREVMLHELGHLVGLAHVKDTTQVMYPKSLPLAHYSAGDRRGLAILGDGPCPNTY